MSKQSGFALYLGGVLIANLLLFVAIGTITDKSTSNVLTTGLITLDVILMIGTIVYFVFRPKNNT